MVYLHGCCVGYGLWLWFSNWVQCGFRVYVLSPGSVQLAWQLGLRGEGGVLGWAGAGVLAVKVLVRMGIPGVSVSKGFCA